MKRALIRLVLAAAIAVLGLAPFQSTELATLKPARIILVQKEKGILQTVTDTGAIGRGATLDAALLDMQQTSPGTLFLDTAQSVVFHISARGAISQAANSEALRPAAKVYLLLGAMPEAEDAADYLKTYSGELTLGKLRAAYLGAGEVRLPWLQNQEGRLRLIDG